MQNDLTLDAGFDRSFAHTAGGSVRYLVADLKAPDWLPSTDRPPLNLAIVIDRSGSMSGAPLEAAKDAARGIVQRLAPKDRLSLVSFDDNVIVHVDGALIGNGAPEALKAIAAIEPGGSTDLAAGWLAGAGCLAGVAAREEGVRSHVIVLSDGHANRGVVAPELLEHLADQQRRLGITTSAVGIGDGYSTIQLQALCDYGGGRLHDAEHPHEIVEVVLAELQALDAVTAADVQLEVAQSPDVRVECLSPYPVKATPTTTLVVMGGIVGAQAGQPHALAGTRHVVFRVTAPAAKPGISFAFEVRAS